MNTCQHTNKKYHVTIHGCYCYSSPDTKIWCECADCGRHIGDELVDFDDELDQELLQRLYEKSQKERTEYFKTKEN